MRKNSIRKFVHAILDLIPLFIIPIFAIYTRNENYNSNIEIQTYQNTTVDFNQYIQNGNFNNGTNGYNPVRCSITLNNNVLEVNGTGDNFYCEYAFSSIESHVYIARAYIESDTTVNNFRFYAYYNNLTSYMTTNIVNNELTQYDLRFVPTQTSNNCLMRVIGVSLSTGNKFYMNNFQLFDLTQMFGVGKEPTNIDFENYFQSTYYDYTTSELKIIDTVQNIYNDTDVGSQFVYTLYNATDKYFNMNNVFNMRDVYDWFVLNIFGGNAPLGLYIVWNIVLYEFVMDLLMLLYGVFMFFIDCCTKLIEKPLNAIK